MRDPNILQHLLVITCLHYLLVGTAVAAPPANVHSGKALSENDNPLRPRRPFSLLSHLRDRRELRNDALNEEAAPEQNLRKAESAPSVQRRAVDYLKKGDVNQLLMGDGYDLDERQKREVENDMGEYEGHDRWVRNADVAQVPLFELELREDDAEITAGDGLLQRMKRQARKKKKKKKKGKKKPQKGNNKPKKKPASKKKSKNKKKPSKGKKSKKGNSKKGKKQGSKRGKKSKKNKKKPKMQARVYKLKSVKPLFLTCLLHSMFLENPNPDKYLSPLVYLLKESNGSMMNMSMDSTMAMNGSSMMATNDSAMTTLSLESLLNQNLSMRPYGHYFYTFGDSMSSFPGQKLPLKNIGDHNITDTELMYIRGLLKKVMSMLFMKEGTRYDVDGFIMELEMNLNESMPALMSSGKNSPEMVCPSLEKNLLSGMNGLMTIKLVKYLHEGLTALLANDTNRFVRGLLHEGDKSFEILYLMRNTGTSYKEGKAAMLLSCLFESLFDGYVGKDILMYLLPYLADNMMMNGTDNGMMSMMDNSSMSQMMNNTMTTLPVNESNETSPSFNPSTIMDSQYCNDSMTDPMMIFMYVMNMTNMTMADGDMNMTMDVLKSILAKLKRSTNESVVNAHTAPSLLLPAVMVYMENASGIYRTKAIHHAIRYLINYGIDMKSMDVMDDMNDTTGGGMNMSSSMNQTANATSDMDMMGNLDGMGIPDAICPAMVKEFLPKMDKSAKMEFFRRFLWASKFLLCGDSEDWQEVIETGMVDMMEGMDGDDSDDGDTGDGGDMMP